MPAYKLPGYKLPDLVRVHRTADDLIASLKQTPNDFVVHELLQPDFSGQGEHLYLYVEKTGQNTSWVAKQLGNAFGVSEKHVGYSGLKDRRAVTRQWFSLPVPEAKSRISPEIPSVSFLQKERHSVKLRRGTHLGNKFQIRLRDFEGEFESAEQRLKAIDTQGFPNYFGSQRFGFQGNNVRAGLQLAKARKLVGHSKRGIYLSAMRSALFNHVLAQQIQAGSWPAIVEADTPATGPMWGRGRPLSAEIGQEIESGVLRENEKMCDLLEHAGLSQERRNLRQNADNLSWVFEGRDLLLEFSLPPGSYATVLLEEVTCIRPEPADDSPK